MLDTKRIFLRPYQPGDLEPYCAMEQDAAVRRYVGGAPRTREAAELKFRALLEPMHDRMGLWTTVLKGDSCYIGRCGVYPHFQDDAVVSGEGVLAFYLARPFWGQGLATEAGRALVKFGFGALDLHRIVATVQTEHKASIRVLEKLGFSLVGREQGNRTFDHFALARSQESTPQKER